MKYFLQSKKTFLYPLILLFIFIRPGHSSENIIKLIQIKEGVWFYNPTNEQPNKKNQGLIANLGVIIGKDKILVVDSGSSRENAKKFISEIRKISQKPIDTLVITHRHFDHSFGINPFIDLNCRIIFDEKEFSYFSKEGPKIKKMLTKAIGLEENSIDFKKIKKEDIFFLKNQIIIDLGEREVLIKNIGEAHTSGDIIVFDYKTKTYFGGDFVFRGRAAAFTDANIKKWKQKIFTQLDKSWEFLVPGHGSLMFNTSELKDTTSWLKFIDKKIIDAIQQGDMISEILNHPIPKDIEHLSLIKETMRQGLRKQLNKYNLK